MRSLHRLSCTHPLPQWNGSEPTTLEEPILLCMENYNICCFSAGGRIFSASKMYWRKF